MKTRLPVATIMAALSVASANAHAAEISLDSEKPVTITISGMIESGDADRFRSIANANPRAIVMLESPGGEVATALAIGAMINKAGMTTFVGSQITCASSCALVWLAGRRRVLQQGSRVGFHASYRFEGNDPVEDGSSNALIGSYLTMLGLPLEAVVFATSKGPNELSWIDTSRTADHGIAYALLPLTAEQKALAREKDAENSGTVGGTFGSWKALAAPEQAMFLTADKAADTAMFLQCRKGYACRYGFSFGIGCDAGDSYSVTYTVGGYSPTETALTCDMGGKIMYVDETMEFDKAIEGETFVRVKISLADGSHQESRFSLVGLSEAYNSAKERGYIRR